jgi:uncharacterized protein YndB with AHSA1/START domain
VADDFNGFTVTRLFDAPRELVWREWTEPERFADWFGGADADVPLDTVSMDVREGGAWRLRMFFGPDRRESSWHGEYRELEPPERLVMTMTDLPPGGDRYALITVVLSDLGDGRTEMFFEQRDDMTPPQHEAARRGWGKFFDRVDERLAGTAS